MTQGEAPSCLAVVIRGDVRKTFSRFEEDAVDGTLVEMPAEERHEDLFGPDGARIVLLHRPRSSSTLPVNTAEPPLRR